MRKLGIAALLLGAALSSAQAANFGGYDNGIAFTPTLTATTYTSGQSMGGLITVQVFRTSTILSWIFDAFQITSKTGVTTAPLTFYTYDTKPSVPCVDTSSYSENTADIAKRFMAPFTLTPATAVGASSATAQLLQVVSGQNHDSPQTQNLYICIVAGGSYVSPSTSDLIGKISGGQD